MTKRREFGQCLKSIRMEKQLTLIKASEALGYKSIGTVNNVEQGLTPLPIEKIHAIADLYGMDLEALLVKIADCEPELYRRYQTLAGQIISHFTAKVAGLADRQAGLQNASYGTKGDRKYTLYDAQNRPEYFYPQANEYFLRLSEILSLAYNWGVSPPSPRENTTSTSGAQLDLDLKPRLPNHVIPIRDKRLPPRRDQEPRRQASAA